jgi:YfiH family protein
MLTPVADGFEWRDGALGPVLVARALEPVADHLFTGRSRRFTSPGDDADYAALGVTLGVPPDRIVRVRQVHGRTVLVVRPGDRPGVASGDADAVVCLAPGVAASVRVADCVPLLIGHAGGRVVAAVHAGWRGTCAGIAGAAIRAIADEGIPPGELVAAIGPAIGACCYQVDDRVRTTFLGMTPDAVAWFTEDGPGHWRLDLARANADQHEDAGVRPEAIHLAAVCTADHPEACFSHRREGGGAGRMVAAIVLRT